MIHICEITGDVFHEEDGFKTSEGYLSLRGVINFCEARHRYLKNKGTRNFFLFLFPYFFPLTLLLIGVIQVIFKIEILFDWLALILMITPIVIFGIGAKKFLSDRSLLQEIGDPERAIVETSGTINLETGSVAATSRAYDTYSGTQWVMMLVNVLLFFLALVINIVVGWIYYIIYIVRRHKFSKLRNSLFQIYVDLPDENETMFWACENNKDETDEFCLVDGNGNCIEDRVSWFSTFYYNNQIFTMFKSETKENCFYAYEILVGYKPRAITTDQEFNEVMKIHDSIDEE